MFGVRKLPDGVAAVTLAAAAVFARPVLNDFMALPAPVRRATRARLSELLREDTAALREGAGGRGRGL